MLDEMLQKQTERTVNAVNADPSYCGKGALLGQHPETGRLALIPMCCKRWTCPACARRLSRMWAKRAVQAKPERFLTITVDPALHESPLAAYDALKAAFQKMVLLWRKPKIKDGKILRPEKVFEYMAMWEVQPGTGMPHLHVLQKGDYLPHKWVSAFMQRAKIGTVADIRRIDNAEKAAAYVVKYTQKAGPSIKDLIGRNRLIMCSQKFFAKDIIQPEAKQFDGYIWTHLMTDAATCLMKLVKTSGYQINADRWPAIVELVPTREIEPLEAVADRLDNGWLLRNSGTWADAALAQEPEYEEIPF